MDRIVLITKPTRLAELVREHFTEGAARFALESRGQSFKPYLDEEAAYRRALTEIRRQIPNDVPVTLVSREEAPKFLFREKDLVIICGPDGLFVNAAKYLGDQLVITVNPDPRTVAGVLMRFPPEAVGRTIEAVRNGTADTEELPFIKAVIDEDQVVWGINDVFIGRRDHVSSRYSLAFEGCEERQSSSGIIVSSGVGSTGWLRSVRAMVAGLVPRGTPQELDHLPEPTSDELVFVVREPFPSPQTGTSVVTGRILPESPLTVTSEMADGGYVFSDGVVERMVSWKAGSTVVVSVGERYVNRVV